MGAREVRGRAGKKRTDLVDAVRSLHGPELRVELVAVFEERQVGDYVSPGWSLMLSRLRRARGESPPSGPPLWPDVVCIGSEKIVSSAPAPGLYFTTASFLSAKYAFRANRRRSSNVPNRTFGKHQQTQERKTRPVVGERSHAEP